METYEINEETLALMAQEDGSTIVHEYEKDFVIDNKATSIMEDSCEYFGSTLDGRQKGTTNLTGITHKVPIIVEESRNIIFFPTSSPRVGNCCWISLNNIAKYYHENKKTIIVFKDGSKIKLDISFGIIDNQILRATRLESVLNDRKNIKNVKKVK